MLEEKQTPSKSQEENIEGIDGGRNRLKVLITNGISPFQQVENILFGNQELSEDTAY